MSYTELHHIDREKLLIEGLLRRDKDALEELYDNYSAALLGAIMRIITNKDIAEEVLQDTFFKIWEKIDTYSTIKGRLYTWMYSIARNKALDKIRSKEYSQMSVTDTINDLGYQSIEIKDEDQGNYFSDELLKFLKPEQSLIIKLMYFQGYTSEDVSKKYKIPLGTVKSRVRAALKRLRAVHGIP